MNKIAIVAVVIAGALCSFPSISAPSILETATSECDSLAKNESENWSLWASGQGLTKSDIGRLVTNLCYSGISTAKSASKPSDLDEWQIAMFNRMSRLGLGPLNTNAVQKSTKIAKRYYQQLNGVERTENIDKQDAPYPSLSDGASQEQKTLALKEYASTKKINGHTISSRCEKLSASMPDNSAPSPELKRSGIQVCEGVMTMNTTNGKHGIDGITARNIAEKTYGKSSMEYRYIEQITNLAFSESK